jgi:hypothetical protein
MTHATHVQRDSYMFAELIGKICTNGDVIISGRLGPLNAINVVACSERVLQEESSASKQCPRWREDILAIVDAKVTCQDRIA